MGTLWDTNRTIMNGALTSSDTGFGDDGDSYADKRGNVIVADITGGIFQLVRHDEDEETESGDENFSEAIYDVQVSELASPIRYGVLTHAGEPWTLYKQPETNGGMHRLFLRRSLVEEKSTGSRRQV